MFIEINSKGYVTDFSCGVPIKNGTKVLDLHPSEMEDFLRYYNFYYFEDGDLLRDDRKIEEFENELRRRSNQAYPSEGTYKV